jgi:3-hydroxyisobutyrate dehydrogenase-like beta-hydroxyacid dehydrogenase
VVGLGTIGGRVADNLITSGLPVVVCDVRAEAADAYRGRAEVVGSAADVARGADIVVVAVFDDAQVHAVLSGPDGGLAAAGPGTVFLIVSTISAGCVAAIGAEAADAGISVIDCGITGGPGAAASGDLVCMVGGDASTLERAVPVLDAMGSLTLHMGPFGAGLAAKLARNLAQYGAWLAAYEGQVLAEAAGVELAKLAKAIRTSDERTGGVAALMFRTTVAPFTATDDPGLVEAMRQASSLAHKDLGAALELGRALGVDLPLGVMTEARCDVVFGLRGAVGAAPSEAGA